MNNELIVVENEQLVLAKEGIKQIKKFQEMKLKMTIMEEELKKNFQEAMEKTGITKYTSPDGSFKVNYVAETVTHKFNSTKFKEDHEKLYKEYITILPKKAYVKFN